MSGKPYPKSRQLARGARRYRRKVASAKQWQKIIAAKQGPCRVCVAPSENGSGFPVIQFHHLVPRDAPYFGDDTEDNIVPLCGRHHRAISLFVEVYLAALADSLTDAEYAYIIAKLGEGGIERLFGVGKETHGKEG